MQANQIMDVLIEAKQQGKVVNTGENWKNQSFTFTLTPLEKTNPMPENKTVEIKSDTKDYQALFGAIKYTKPGTYSYTITEDQTKPEGNIKYDQASYTATVTVSEDMTASVKYTKNDETKASPDSAVFNNVITSTKPESNTISISGTKTWNDNNDQDGKRPDKITVNLLANGVKTASKIVTAENGWNYTFDNQPKYADGKEIKYTVTEDPVASYTTTISGYNITNTENTVTPPTPTPTYTTYTVHKVWKLDDGRTAASSVQAQLYRNGEAYGDPVTLSAGNHWSYLWTGLTKTDAQGNTISWTVREVNVPSGFTSTVTGTDRSFTITNDDKPQDNHNKHNNSEHPNNHNNNKNNKPVHPSSHNKNNTTVHPGTPTIPKNTGKTAVHHGIAAGGTPRTGDQTSLGFWLAMLLAGAAGTAAALLFKRRNRKEEE
jgi:pilin isopeptide linkage protein